MPKITAEELEQLVKIIVPYKSVVLVQVPDEKYSETSIALYELSEGLSDLNIVFLACPMDLKMTVVPQGSDIVMALDERESNPFANH